jgi:hypothetical protein
MEVVNPLEIPVAFQLEAVKEDGEIVWMPEFSLETGLPVGSDGRPQLPAGGWQRGDVVSLAYGIQLPPTLSGRHQLRLAAHRGGDPLPVRRWWGLLNSNTLELGQVEIAGREPRLDIPPLSHEVGESWNGQVELLGYNTDPIPARTSMPAKLTLVWRASGMIERPYKIFVHAVDDEGTFIAGADAFFDVPPTLWQEDEILISEHHFAANALPVGHYTLIVGLYLEESGERLEVNAPNFALPIGEIEVAE